MKKIYLLFFPLSYLLAGNLAAQSQVIAANQSITPSISENRMSDFTSPQNSSPKKVTSTDFKPITVLGKPMTMQIGAGLLLAGTGDVVCRQMETELSVKLNNYFTFAGNITFGKSVGSDFDQSAFYQFNTNILVSPFKNSRKNDFRIGTGLSISDVTDVYDTERMFENNQLVYTKAVIDKRTSTGVNFILDYQHQASQRFIVGARLINQQYTNGDINTGFLVRMGWRL
jgi:hypothetical protein